MTAGVVDDEWLAAPPKRSRLRLLLLVLLAGTLVFFAGVEVQKRYGAAAAPAAAAAPRFSGAGGFTLPAGAGTGTTTGGGAATTAQSAVIGTLESVKGDVWTVKDLGGHVHRISVASTVQIVKEKRLTASDVAAGTTVDVSGTTDAQGRVTATTITVRSGAS